MAFILPSRKDTPFEWDSKLDKIIDKLDDQTAAAVLTDMDTFAIEYQKSKQDTDIPDRYQFKPLKSNKQPTRKQKPPWSLHQIYCNMARHRAVLMFTPQRAAAWWVWVFKKGHATEDGEIELARKRAEAVWARITSKENKSKRSGISKGKR